MDIECPYLWRGILARRRRHKIGSAEGMLRFLVRIQLVELCQKTSLALVSHNGRERGYPRPVFCRSVFPPSVGRGRKVEGGAGGGGCCCCSA